MTLPPSLLIRRWLVRQRFGFFLCLLGASLFGSSAHAQKQERGLLDRIDHPDLTMKFDPADKHFGVASAAGNRQAMVKAFSFGKESAIFGGDGAFRTKAFGAKNNDALTKSFDAKTSTLSQRNSFAQADKGFGTKSMDVRDAPSARTKPRPVLASTSRRRGVTSGTANARTPSTTFIRTTKI